MRTRARKEDNTKPKGVLSSSAPSPSSPSPRAKMNNNPNAGESRSSIQVDKTTGPVFGKREDSDIQEISSNNFYQKCKGTAKNDLGNKPNKQDKLSTSKEEERAHENYSGTKRAHVETSNPTNGYLKSPSRNEEANKDAPANKSATATATSEVLKRVEQGLWGSPSMGSGTIPPLGTTTKIPAPIKSNGRNVRKRTSKIAGKPSGSTSRCAKKPGGPSGEQKLMNLEPKLVERIKNEIMNQDTNVSWDDIAGLEHAKKCVTETVVWPILRPDIFNGCRSPGRGLLLFGPPGTGKTMIGKAIAGEAKATFFYISASSLTSKWFGEAEKLVSTLFEVASTRQPAVIFVDEIDSLLCQRMSGEHEATRRIKTQFFVEMDGFMSGRDQILLIGATNRPQELDEAARRRLTKRLYIPLPCSEARAWIIRNLLEKDGLFKLSNVDIDTICKLTEGYSGSDMTNLVRDASMGPLREVFKQGIEITKLKKGDMRPVSLQDFKDALQEIRPSVAWKELAAYDEWNKQFGSMSL